MTLAPTIENPRLRLPGRPLHDCPVARQGRHGHGVRSAAHPAHAPRGDQIPAAGSAARPEILPPVRERGDGRGRPRAPEPRRGHGISAARGTARPISSWSSCKVKTARGCCAGGGRFPRRGPPTSSCKLAVGSPSPTTRDHSSRSQAGESLRHRCRGRQRSNQGARFGIAKLRPSSGHVATGTGSTFGTTHYMSPEQARGAADVDPRTDVWSLGVVLYELLGGRRPFDGEQPLNVVHQILSTAPVELETLRPGLPAGLAAVVGKAMQKDVARRFATIQALADALAPFAAPRSRSGTGRLTAAASRCPRPPRPRGRRRRVGRSAGGALERSLRWRRASP